MSKSHRFVNPIAERLILAYIFIMGGLVGITGLSLRWSWAVLIGGETVVLGTGLAAWAGARRYQHALDKQAEYLDTLRDNYQHIFTDHPQPLWVSNGETFLAVNHAALELYGYDEAAFLALTWSQLREAAQVQPPASGAIEQHRTRAGQHLTVRIHATPCDYDHQRATLFLVQDMTQQETTLAQLQQQEARYRMLASNFPQGAVMLYDLDLRYTLAAGTGLHLLQADEHRLEGRTLTEALNPETAKRLEPLYRRALQGEAITTELPLAERTYLTHVLPVRTTDGVVAGGMSVTQDITERKQMEQKLQDFAYADQNTQLPNRTWFLKKLREHLTECQSGVAGFFSVFFLELERFDSVKYSLGNRWAEQMMTATAERLMNCLNLSEPVARVGDHALALILGDLHTQVDANAIADYIHQQLNQPLEIDDQELFSTVTIGIAIVDAPELMEQSPEGLLQSADTAMNHARTMYLPHAIFEPMMSEQAVGRFNLETNLRWAIKRQEFSIFYQPIVSLKKSELIGFESLIRWRHPDMGWIAPGQFLPVAEETGLIGLIDWWVLGEVCRQLGQWQRQSQKPLMMSLNASGALLSQFGFQERLRQVILGNRIQRGTLKLEVTERVMMEQHTAASGLLEQIKNLGVQLAVDDFGTGYSCLQHLHQLPIDILKIDASFVQRMLNDVDSMEIIQTIIALAHSLKMDVIAEGVEQIEQVEQLRSLNCEYAQGHLFCEPLMVDVITEMLANGWQPNQPG